MRKQTNNTAVITHFKVIIKGLLHLSDKEVRSLLLAQLAKRIVIRVRDNNGRLSSLNHQLQFLELRLVLGEAGATNHLVLAKEELKRKKEREKRREKIEEELMRKKEKEKKRNGWTQKQRGLFQK